MEAEMFEQIFSGSTIPVLEQVVNFTQATDTFQARLKEAIEARDDAGKSVSGSQTQPTREEALADVRESMHTLLYHDESNDGLEQQVTEIAKNQGQHSTAIALMRSQFSLLQAAISERV
jgi:flagellar basal-body rod protein FlgB